MQRTPARIIELGMVLLLLACGRPESAIPAPSEASPPSPAVSATRTLVVAVGRAPESLGAKPLRDTGQSGSPRTAIRAFNAGLALNDAREVPRPYLAESLPELGSDSWQVFPDGGMETTYRLRPNLAWHDGAPLSAEDVVFAWRVYRTPDLGWAASPPVNLMEEVRAPDDRTVVIRWSQPYPAADDLQATDLPPLPRHLLAAPWAQLDAEAFVAHPFWLSDYVGLGPYRLRHVELGAFVEGEAFEGHALGRPRLATIRFVALPDPNLVVGTLLSGAAHVATDSTISDEEQAAVLERSGGGIVVRSPTGVRHPNFQLRPDYASTPALLDVRVRKAVIYATDRQSLAETLTQGLTTVADTLVLREVDYYPALDRVLTKYPYDPGAAAQLLAEAGFTPGADGIYARAGEGRLGFELATPQGTRNEAEVTIMADGLRRFGIDASVHVIPRVQVNQPLVTSHYPGMFNAQWTRAFEAPISRLRASEIARAETRWRGSNWSGFNHPGFERLVQHYDATLDRGQRTADIVDMLKLVSEEVPTFGLFYGVSYIAHVANLRGPQVTLSADASSWSLDQWDWTS